MALAQIQDPEIGGVMKAQLGNVTILPGGLLELQPLNKDASGNPDGATLRLFSDPLVNGNGFLALYDSASGLTGQVYDSGVHRPVLAAPVKVGQFIANTGEWTPSQFIVSLTGCYKYNIRFMAGGLNYAWPVATTGISFPLNDAAGNTVAGSELTITMPCGTWANLCTFVNLNAGTVYTPAMLPSGSPNLGGDGIVEVTLTQYPA